MTHSQDGVVPRKLRQLRVELHRAGFRLLTDRGKGSHTVWRHEATKRQVTIPGADGDDAKPYQEKEVRQAVESARLGRPQH